MSNKKISGHYERDSNRIVIDEEAHPGDYLDLTSFSILEELVSAKLDEKYKQQVINTYKQGKEYQDITDQIHKYNQLKNSLDEMKRNTINEFKTSDEYKALEQEKHNLIIEINKLKDQQEINKSKAIEEFKKSDEYTRLVDEKNDLKANLKSLESRQQRDIANAKENAMKEIRLNEVAKLEKLNTKLETELKNSYHKNVDEFKKTDEYKSLVDELEEYKNKHNRRLQMNSKVIGEDLENWCEHQFNDSFQQVNDVKFEKTTKPIHGKKPDFIFTVFTKNNKKIASIVLEMKTDNGENKTRNDSFLETLELNRKNFEAEFGLLVTNLELKDEFIIRKAMGYESLFLVRPEHFVYVLILFRLIYSKCDLLMNELKSEATTSQHVLEVINEFTNFKEDLFQSSLKNINSQLDKIYEAANKIQAQVDNIKDSISLIQSKHLQTVQNKIESFTKKIQRKEDKLISN